VFQSIDIMMTVLLKLNHVISLVNLVVINIPVTVVQLMLKENCKMTCVFVMMDTMVME